MKAHRALFGTSEQMPQRQTTVLFARLTGEQGKTDPAPLRKHCIDPLVQAVELGGGRVVRQEGDSVMAVFATPDAAVAGAARMNAYIEARGESAGLAVKVGLETGGVTQNGRDVLGDTVNLALQFSRLAGNGQVVTSARTAAKFTSAIKSAVQPMGSGNSASRETRPLREVAWRGAAHRIIAEQKDCATNRYSSIRLSYADKVIVRRREWDVVTCGREPKQDLVIREMSVSKQHCEIIRQLGVFVLKDFSTNGTFVTKEREGEVHVHRSEVVLSGAGWIGLGQSCDITDDVIRYFCE